VNKRKKETPDFPAMPFDEALARLLQTDPKEIADAFEQNKERSDDIKRSVDGRRQRLRSATRGPKKKFSL
jgi:hypothetical protein